MSVSNLTAVGEAVWGLTNGVVISAQAGTKYYIRLYNGDTNDFGLSISPCAAPLNDNFADRIVIPPGSNSVVGTLVGATIEPGEPVANYRPSPSVWWSWRPQTNGLYWVNVVPATRRADGSVASGQPFDSQSVRAFAGDDVSTLTPMQSSSGSFPLILHASTETNYHLVVIGGMASFALEIRPVSSPPNDDFSSAIPLHGPVAAQAGTTIGATLEPGEPLHWTSYPYDRAAHSVWYRWSAPSNGFYSVLALYASSLDVYRGDSLPGLSVLASNANSHVLQLVGGVEYHLAVAGGTKFQLVIRPAVVPENDNFDSPKVITGLHAKFSVPVADATVESGEPAHNGSASPGSVWFSWTAPADGTYAIRIADYGPGNIAVYTGDSLDELVPIGAGSAEFVAAAGVNYRIAVQANFYREAFRPQTVWLELRHIPQPRNDSFARRLRLSGVPVSIVASNVGATLQTGELRNGPSAFGHTVWWKWRAPRTGRVTFSVEYVGGLDYFSGVLGVYEGNSIDTLTPLSSTNLDASVLNLPVQAGHEYQISVDNGWGLTGQFRLGLRYTIAPPNDAFAGRISFAEQAAGTLEGASRETGEPGSESDPNDASVWWTWTAPASGVYELTFGTYTGLSSIEVFNGNALEALVPVDAESSYRIYRRFRATAGTAYVIRVSGPATGGQYTLRASFRPPPTNDRFSDRITLVGTKISVVGSNSIATAEPNEPAHAGDAALKSVWWSWTAPTNGMARISPLGYVYERIAVYKGEQLEALQLVRAGYGTVVFPAESGINYQIAVDTPSYRSEGSDIMSWSLVVHEPPSNDAFANRIALQGEATTATGTALGASREPGEPKLWSSRGYSVWWKWVTPETGRYTFDVSASVGVPALVLYSGRELTNLVVVANNLHGFEAVNVLLSAGTELAISIDPDLELPGYNGSFVLKITRTAVPANDNFADRAVLPGGTVTGNLEGSSLEPDEPDFQSDPGGTSIWWRHTPTNSGWFSIVATTELNIQFPWNSYSDVSVAVFTGTNFANLSRVPPYGDSRPTAFRLEAGTEYSIQASGRYRWFGPLWLSVAPLSGPSNDQFAKARTILSDHAILTGSNDLASVESGEPAREFGDENSIWWKWTAVSNGVYAITRSNSPVFAYVDVYTGTSVSNLTQVPNTAYGRETGEYLFRASAGTTYYISAATSVSEGVIRLAFTRVSPPPNDDFANRMRLTGSHISILASNFDATAEPGDPFSEWSDEQTVWWKWIAPASGIVTLDAQADGVYFDGGVFWGDSISSLEALAMFFLPLKFYATKGEEYVIGISTSFSPATQFTLSLDVSELSLFPNLTAGLPVARTTDKPLMVETSTNLVDWVPFSTLAPGEKEFRVVPNQTEPQRFFRIR